MEVITTRGLIGNYIRERNLTIAASADMLTESLEMNYDFSHVKISITPTASGVLSIVRTRNSISTVEKLNSGNALGASSLYSFTFPVLGDETINFRYSVADTIKYLMAYECL